MTYSQQPALPNSAFLSLLLWSLSLSLTLLLCAAFTLLLSWLKLFVWQFHFGQDQLSLPQMKSQIKSQANCPASSSSADQFPESG